MVAPSGVRRGGERAKNSPYGRMFGSFTPLRRGATAYAVARNKRSACGASSPLARPKNFKISIVELFWRLTPQKGRKSVILSAGMLRMPIHEKEHNEPPFVTFPQNVRAYGPHSLQTTHSKLRTDPSRPPAPKASEQLLLYMYNNNNNNNNN